MIFNLTKGNFETCLCGYLLICRATNCSNKWVNKYKKAEGLGPGECIISESPHKDTQIQTHCTNVCVCVCVLKIKTISVYDYYQSRQTIRFLKSILLVCVFLCMHGYAIVCVCVHARLCMRVDSMLVITETVCSSLIVSTHCIRDRMSSLPLAHSGPPGSIRSVTLTLLTQP